MKPQRLVWQYSVVLWVFISLAGCNLSALRNPTPTPLPTAVVKVNADEVARAMQEDNFYGEFSPNMLLIEGTVLSVRRQGSGMEIELQTSVPTKVLCDLSSQANGVQAGDSITVQALAADAQRAPSAVVLKNCSLP